MATDRKEVELLIRAREVGTKNFQNTANAVRDITAALDEQLAAAARGEGSVKDLEASYKKLKEAGEALIRQQGLIDLYGKISTQLDEAQVKAKAAAEAHETFAKAVAGTEAPTRAQSRELNSLAKASEAAQRKADTLAASQAAQAERLNTAGISVEKLSTVQQQLVASARDVGASLTAAGSAIDGYDVKVNALTASQQKLKDDQAFHDQLVGAEKLRQASSYVNFWSDALAKADVEQQRLTELTSFQKLGDDALASSAKLNSFADRASNTATQSSRLAQSLQGVIDPAGRARSTLAGLESEVARVSAVIGSADKPVRDYQEAINDLGRIQGSILKQAGDIDAFRNQKAVVEEAGAAVVKYEADLVRAANAVKSAKAPNEQLARSLKTAEANANAASAAYQREAQKLAALKAPLVAAEVNINDLAAAENRLRAASETTSVAVGKLDKAMSGKGSKVGGFLGLRPYELQNLSYQINDVFTQLASGTSVTQTLAQQGGQFVQLFPRAFGAVAAFLPEIIAVGAALFTVYSTLKRVFDLQSEEKAFSAGLAATADAAQYNAHQLAEMSRAVEDSGVKAKDATAAFRAFIKEGIDQRQILEYTMAARSMSKVLGIEVPDAAKQMATAFSGGYEEVAKLDDEFDFLTAAERKQIKAMFDSGETAKARTAAFEAFSKRMNEAANLAEGKWAKAMRGLGIIWHNFLDALADTPVLQGVIALLSAAADQAERLGNALPQGQQIAGAIRGLPQGVQFQNPNSFGMPASRPSSFMSTPVVTPEIKDIIVTAMREARTNDLEGIKAVVAVILNRMERSGQTGSEVVRAPGQFEPWMTAEGRLKLAEAAKDTERFNAALQAALPLLRGLERDPTNGATLFVSPGGQRAMGRQMPAWANSPSWKASIGGQEFYGGRFPGDRGRTNPNGPSEASLKAGEDYIAQLKEQIALNEKLDDAERIRLAGLEAIRGAQSAGADPRSQQEAKRLAETAEAAKIAIERAQQANALAGELSSSLDAAAAAQDRSLAQRLDAIVKQYDVLRAKVAEARSKGLTEVDGKSLDQVLAILAANEEILKQKETMKFYEEQVASLERQRADAMTDVANKVATGQMTAAQAAARVQEINANLLPQLTEMSRKAVEFATALRTATPSPALEAFIAKMTTAASDAQAASARDLMKIYEQQLAAIDAARDQRLSAINQKLRDGNLSTVEALQQAAEVQAEFNPQIAQLAADAKAFAESISGATPNATLQAFIAKMDQLGAAAGNNTSPSSPVAQTGQIGISADEAKLNEIIANRNNLVASYIALRERGAMTDEAARDATAAAYAEAQPLIDHQLDILRQTVEKMYELGQITPQAYQAWIAKLQEVRVEAQYLDENFVKIKDTIVSTMSNAAVESIHMVIDAIDAAIEGTGSWKDVLTSLGDAALNFVGSFLKGLSDMLIQMMIIAAIKKLPFLDSATKGLGDFTGLIAGASALGVAGGVLNNATEGLTTGAGALGVAALAWIPVAQQIQAAADAMMAAAAMEMAASFAGFHSGGISGQGTMRRTNINPAVFRGAPRYHSGTVGVGLRPNEQAAILKKGEEVLTEDNPRHIKNQIAGAMGGSMPSVNVPVKVINAIDAGDMVSQGIATPAGEKAVLNFISNNPQAVQKALGS